MLGEGQPFHHHLQIYQRSILDGKRRSYGSSLLWRKGTYVIKLVISVMGLNRPLDGDTNLKYNLLCFLTPNKKNFQRERH